MEKQHILDEIKRTASENGGKPLGRERFESETGIKPSDWYGKYWIKWGDALKEARFSPNELQGAYSDDFILEKLCSLIREIGHFPVQGELLLKNKRDPSFPSQNVFARLGNKRARISRVIEYANQKQLGDIIGMVQPDNSSILEEKEYAVPESKNDGFVYLIKSGKYCKIGRTNAIGRREYEIALQLPEKANLLHKIKTDDPVGIEAYWHSRFENKRLNGEWFSLTAADVSAFQRRKFM